MSELRPELIVCDDPIRCDLMRHNVTGETFLIDQYEAREFIAENPSFSIVGIGLSHDTTDTPYGKIGAVIE
jgi:hypothetical protein